MSEMDILFQVPDAFIIQLCASKALFAETSKSLRCNSLHGELIVNISGSRHVMCI